MTELRAPEVAPHPAPAGPNEPVPAASELQPDGFKPDEPPTMTDHNDAPGPSRAATRPLLGPAAWIGGAALWAYVVAGQLVLRAGMPEVLGVACVAGTAVTTAYIAGARSLELLPTRDEDERKARYVKPTWVGLVAAAGVVFLASLMLSRLGDGPTMLVLLTASVASVVLGQRATGRPRDRLRGWRRALGIAAWIAAALLGLVAVLSVR